MSENAKRRTVFWTSRRPKRQSFKGLARKPKASSNVSSKPAFGVVQLALPLTLYFYAARYLSAPTLIFVVLIDAVFAPIWVWLGFDEVPARLAFIGAGLILVSVAFNAGLGVRNMRRAPGTW